MNNHQEGWDAVQAQHAADEQEVAEQNIMRLIVYGGLLFQVRTVDPDQAMWLARKNGTLSPETFTLKYDGQLLKVENNGDIIPEGIYSPNAIVLIIKDHLIYEARRIPQVHEQNIITANEPTAQVFYKKYAGCTL